MNVVVVIAPLKRTSSFSDGLSDLSRPPDKNHLAFHLLLDRFFLIAGGSRPWQMPIIRYSQPKPSVNSAKLFLSAP